MKFTITVKKGLCTKAYIKGTKDVKKHELSVEDLDKVIQTEAFLEKLTGLRFHINEA